MPDKTKPIPDYSYFQLDCYDLCRKKTVMRACEKKDESMRIMAYFYQDYMRFTGSYESLETACPKDVVEGAKTAFKVSGDVKLCPELNVILLCY